MTAALPLDIPFSHVEIDEAYVSLNVAPPENGRGPQMSLFVHAGGEVVHFAIRAEDQIDRIFQRMEKLARLVRSEMQATPKRWACPRCGDAECDDCRELPFSAPFADDNDPLRLPDDTDADDSAEYADIVRERSVKEEALDDLTAALDCEYRAERYGYRED